MIDTAPIALRVAEHRDAGGQPSRQAWLLRR
jgi:hypothetical protein